MEGGSQDRLEERHALKLGLDVGRIGKDAVVMKVSELIRGPASQAEPFDEEKKKTIPPPGKAQVAVHEVVAARSVGAEVQPDDRESRDPPLGAGGGQPVKPEGDEGLSENPAEP